MFSLINSYVSKFHSVRLYIKCGTCARAFSRTLAHWNSKVEIRKRNMQRKKASRKRLKCKEVKWAEMYRIPSYCDGLSSAVVVTPQSSVTNYLTNQNLHLKFIYHRWRVRLNKHRVENSPDVRVNW